MNIKNNFKLMNISDSDILNNFNITLTSNVDRKIAFLWNQYQIYVLDLQYSANVARELLYSFDIISQIIASHHYLICRDQSGIVWKAIMMYSNLTITEIIPHFDKLEENIISLAHCEDKKLLLSLKMKSNSCNLLVYNLINFNCLNRYEIKNNDINYYETNYAKCKMYCHTMSDTNLLVIITFNGFTLHYTFIDIYKSSNDCVMVEKLLNCPAEINDVHFTNPNVLISLSIGTIIKINFNTLNITKPEPHIIHLNTSIHKILAVNDYLIYTDGQTMWRADNIFGKEEIHFRQIFVKLVKDFVYFNQNEILCTTYMTNLYRFSLDDDTAYIKPVTNTEYCTAKQLLDNISYMHNIISEIEKNNEMTKKIKMEESLITTIALANRQDIVSGIIHFEMAVHENYEDIIENYKLLTLTNDIKDYYTLDSYYLLIKLTVSPVHSKFTNILSDLFGKLEMHITILTDKKVLKTVTLKVIKQLKSMNIVVPLTYLKNTKITVCVKLVTNIPGALDRKQTLWVTLYKKEAVLSSEHFIKTCLQSSNICHLKKSPETIDNLVCENANKHFGNLFKFSKIKHETNSTKWQLYVKLPNNYKELFGNNSFYKHLNSSQTKLLISIMSGDNFLSSGNVISLNVTNEKVEIDIDVGFSNPVLKTACCNLQVASDIRDFISNLLQEHINNSKEEFVSNSILKTLEDIENDVSPVRAESIEKSPELLEKFQKHVIIALNI